VASVAQVNAQTSIVQETLPTLHANENDFQWPIAAVAVNGAWRDARANATGPS